jgi:hypothetical protein
MRRNLAILAIGAAIAGASVTGAAQARTAGSIHIRGGRFIGVTGKPLRLIGVDRSGTEYSCTGPVAGGGFGYGVFQGPADDRSIRALLSWDVDAVALPLNEACWVGGYGDINQQFTGAAYRTAITHYVQRLNHFGIYVVVRLSGAAPGTNTYGSDPSNTDEIPMADADHALAFWTSVATTFRSDPMVLFHTYDEPHDVSWQCLLSGCIADDAGRFGSYQTEGEQAIVDAIRQTGAHQPIILSGPQFAGDLSGWTQYMPHDPLNQLAADVSSFDYGDYVLANESALRSFSRSHPVILGGFGDTDCNSDYSTKLMQFMDSIHQSYLAWTWDTVQDYGGCANALLDDPGSNINGFPPGYYSARPSGFGAGVRSHYRRLNPHKAYG